MLAASSLRADGDDGGGNRKFHHPGVMKQVSLQLYLWRKINLVWEAFNHRL